MRVQSIVLAGVVFLGGCPRSAPSEKRDDPGAADRPGHNDEAAHEGIARRVRLEPGVIAGAKIRTAPVTREVLAATIDLPGELASDPDKTARVSPLVGGRIESVAFKVSRAFHSPRLTLSWAPHQHPRRALARIRTILR